MIITVTMNPALDKTARLDSLRPGELNRLTNVVTDVGGKGINVSKMIAALGGSSLACGFVGGSSGDEILRGLTEQGIAHDFIKVNGTTRTNLKVLDENAGLTEFNEPGVAVTAQEMALLYQKLEELAKPGNIFVFSGSLPEGADAETYARLIHMTGKRGAVNFLDADGEAFRAAVLESPDFIKPNRFELLQYFGIKEAADLPVMAALTRRLREQGVGQIALSMGAEGALFVKGDEALFAPGIKMPVHSSVGAGDSMVGAYAYSVDQGLSWPETAALSLAASAGAVTTIGTKPPSRELVWELRKAVVLKPLKK